MTVLPAALGQALACVYFKDEPGYDWQSHKAGAL
jgi:hypothetical protein